MGGGRSPQLTWCPSVRPLVGNVPSEDIVGGFKAASPFVKPATLRRRAIPPQQATWNGRPPKGGLAKR